MLSFIKKKNFFIFHYFLNAENTNSFKYKNIYIYNFEDIEIKCGVKNNKRYIRKIFLNFFLNYYYFLT